MYIYIIYIYSHLTSKVANAWETWSNRQPSYLPLVDFTDDLWEDADLTSVEEWLTNRLQSHQARRRANAWAVEG